MKIPVEYKPELIVCTDKHRNYIANTEIDIDPIDHRARLVATNGKALVAVPVELHGADEKTGPVSPAALKAARAVAKTNKVCEATLMVSEKSYSLTDGTVLPRVVEPEHSYPRWREATEETPNWPKGEQELPADVVQIGLDAGLLMSLVKAFGGSEGNAHVHLLVKREPDGSVSRPIAVKFPSGQSGEIGILMPVLL